MTPEGIQAYIKYYAVDSVFILAFGFFQCVLLYQASKAYTQRIHRLFLYIIPIARGLCDIIENARLKGALLTYPLVTSADISTAMTATGYKLLMIKIWICELFILIIVGRILKNRGRIGQKNDN